MRKQIKLELFADYFQFYIQDEGVIGDLSEMWTQEAVDRMLALSEGKVGVGTVRNMEVPVTVKIFDRDPDLLVDDKNAIGQINECDLKVTSGKIIIAGCTDSFSDAERVSLANGFYRVRLYYGNLNELSDDRLDGEDFYEIHLWPVEREQGLRVLKQWIAER